MYSVNFERVCSVSVCFPVPDPLRGGSTISPRWGRQLSRGKGGRNIRYCQIFPKTAWNWKNLDPEGGVYADPPLQLKGIGRTPLTGSNFFHFHAVFGKNFFQIIDWRAPRGMGAHRPAPSGSSGFATDRVSSGSKLITNIGKALSFVMAQVFLHVIAVADPNIRNGCPLNPIFFHFHAGFGKNYAKHECVPVGCVLPACWPYPIVSHVSRGRGLPNPPEADPHGCRPPRRQTPWMQTPLVIPLVMWSVMHAGKAPPLWTEGMTNAMWKHYLPQTCFRAVMIDGCHSSGKSWIRHCKL